MGSILCGRSRGPLVGAVVLITLGILLLLVQNHVLAGVSFWKLWPMILIVGGAIKLFQKVPEARAAGAVLVSLGIIFELSEFGYISARPFHLWPLILVGVGFVLLWKALRPVRPEDHETSNVDSFTIFGGVERRISDTNFTGTDLFAMFGGYKIDLRKAVIGGDKAVISATAILGGVELQVPENWNVEIQGVPIFGGYSDETVHPDGSRPTAKLIVTGYALFGGVSVKN
jgi:predicted membrane protein